PIIGKSLEFKGVSAGVDKKHRGLLANLSTKSYGRSDDEVSSFIFQTFCQILPLRHCQNNPEMGDWHILSINRIGHRTRSHIFVQMCDNLMTKQVEINPGAAASTFFTSEQAAIELARRRQVVNRESQMERAQLSAQSSEPFYRARPM